MIGIGVNLRRTVSDGIKAVANHLKKGVYSRLPRVESRNRAIMRKTRERGKWDKFGDLGSWWVTATITSDCRRSNGELCSEGRNGRRGKGKIL